jgi:hypothetical protein
MALFLGAVEAVSMSRDHAIVEWFRDNPSYTPSGAGTATTVVSSNRRGQKKKKHVGKGAKGTGGGGEGTGWGGAEGAAQCYVSAQCVYTLPAAKKAVSAAGLPLHSLEYAVRVLCDPSACVDWPEGKGPAERYLKGRTTSMVYGEMKPIRDLYMQAISHGGQRFEKLREVSLRAIFFPLLYFERLGGCVFVVSCWWGCCCYCCSIFLICRHCSLCVKS